jgi:hypothetical protein
MWRILISDLAACEWDMHVWLLEDFATLNWKCIGIETNDMTSPTMKCMYSFILGHEEAYTKYQKLRYGYNSRRIKAKQSKATEVAKLYQIKLNAST